jgi:hypothetical protein
VSGIAGIILITSHSCDKAGAGWVLAWNWRLQSVVEICGLSPQLGLEPAPHTSEVQVERYLNDSQLILGN